LNIKNICHHDDRAVMCVSQMLNVWSSNRCQANSGKVLYHRFNIYLNSSVTMALCHAAEIGPTPLNLYILRRNTVHIIKGSFSKICNIIMQSNSSNYLLSW